MTVIELERQARAEAPVHRLTVDDWHRMIAAGIFNESDRIELIDGELRTMPPIGPSHAGKGKQLVALLTRGLEGRAILAVQDPLALARHSEPEPDLMLLRPRADFYQTAHPTPADTLLVIEVADSWLTFDRETKVPLYAHHGVPEVWLLDLKARRLEVYRDPGPEGYARVWYPRPDDALAPELLPELVIHGRDLW